MIQMLKKIVKTVFRKQTAIFLFFLMLSANFWLMHSIGTNKEIPITYEIEYINLPHNVKITNLLSKTVNVSVSEGRTSFVNYFFVQQTERLIIDLKDINQNIASGRKVYSIDNMVEQTIKNDFGADAKIANFNPKVIVVEYITLHSKTVPVVLASAVNAKSQFIVYDSIRISPPMVAIYGSAKDIDAVDTLKITDLQLDSLDKNVEIIHTLEAGKILSFDPEEVKINISVAKSTEKSFSVPIECKNAPEGLIMRAFPQSVTVSVLLPLNKFNEIDQNNFTAEIDYKKCTVDNVCPIEVISKIKDINILRISPQEAEFSLEYTKTK